MDKSKLKVKSIIGLLGILIFLTFDLMLFGAGVRALDAGLACPDWPLCFGKVVPDLHLGVWLEFGHRAIAGFVFILFVVLIFKSLKLKGYSGFKWMLGFGFFMLVAQVIMGGLTVLRLLEPGIVTLHLTLATVFLGTLYIMREYAKREVSEKVKNSVSMLMRFLLTLPVAVVFGQIMLGGWVATTYSGMVCVDFPTCNGSLIPTLEGPIGIQVIHRLGAYLTALVVSGFAFYVLFAKSFASNLRLKKLAIYSVVMVFAQIGLGVMNVFLLIPAWMTVLHLAGALVLFRFCLETSIVSWMGEVVEAKSEKLATQKIPKIQVAKS